MERLIKNLHTMGYDNYTSDILEQGGCQKDIEERYKKACKIVHKLGQLEDLEEELGIELITWFKLSKAENVYAYGWNGITKCSLTGINFEEISMWNGTTSLRYPLCEYGKSFALTREELEK